MSTATRAPAPVGIDAALAAALHWLYATVQPPAALVSRRGALLGAGERTLRVVPISATGTPVILVDIAVRVAAGLALNTLPHDELPVLATELTRLGIPHAYHYHGVTGTVTLDVPAHPTLRAAVHRFDAGCPRHNGQRCHESVDGEGYSCSWHADGTRATIWPHTEDTRNRP